MHMCCTGIGLGWTVRRSDQHTLAIQGKWQVRHSEVCKSSKYRERMARWWAGE